MGVYSYAGAAGGPTWLTLFSGRYYQVPIWEIVLAAFWFGSVVALWFFKNDKGQILAERGLDELRGSPRKIQGVRLLACIGLFQAAILVFYNLPMNVVALHWNRWPKDVQQRSYFTNGVCGPSTSYACPDPRIPIPHGTSARVAPDGNIFAPNGLPEPVQR
jgi:hypothetical protein